MANEQGILVIGELNEDGSLANVTGELLGVGRRLAGETGQQVSCALLGKNTREIGKEAIAAGAVAVVAEKAPEKAVSVPWIVVSNTRVALACLATEYHGHPSSQLTVVGITGTNGKTTTSYLLSKVFEAAGYQCGLIGTVTYRIGGREFSSTRINEFPSL